MKKRRSIITIIALFILIITILVGIVFLIKNVILPKFAKSTEEEVPEALAKLYDSGDYISKIDKEIYSQIKSVKDDYGIYAYDIETKEVKDVFRTPDDFKLKKFNNSYDYYLVKMSIHGSYRRFQVGYNYDGNNNITLQIDATCDLEVTDIQTFLSEYIDKKFIDMEIDSAVSEKIINSLSTVISDIFWSDLDASEELSKKDISVSSELVEKITLEANKEILNQVVNGITIKDFYIINIIGITDDYDYFL